MNDPLSTRDQQDRLARAFLNGTLDRREFLRRGSAIGGAVAGSSLLASLLAACGGSASSASTSAAVSTAQIKSGGLLKAALTGEPDSLDPAKSQIYTGAQVYDNVFSKLVDLDENSKVYGVLATRWSQPNATTWVFDLRSGVKFHNGEPFSATDVKYSFERILSAKTASGYAPLYAVIKSIEVNNPTRVTFHLKSSFGPFLTNLANNGEIVNRKAIEAPGSQRKPVGTGPFAFVEWMQGDHITLKANPTYFETGKPHLSGIHFKFALVDQSRIDSLRSGDLDWVDAVPLQQLKVLQGDPTFNYVGSKVTGIPDFLAFNTKQAPFNDQRVRQAVAYAINRDEIRAIAYFGAGESGGEEVPSASPWYTGQTPYKSANIAKAKALLKAAGHSSGLTIQYLGLPQYPELLKTGEVVRQQLQQIGITMNIQQVDVSVWFDRFSKGNYQITSAYQERTIDPDNFYSLVLKTGASINTTGYSSPQADKLIEQAAAAETGMAKRKALYLKLKQLIWADVPLVFVHYETLNYLMRKPVVGSTINPTLELRMQNVGLTST